MHRRRSAAALAGVALVLLGFAGVAWACTVQPVMTVRSTSPGAAGAAPRDVTVATAGSALTVEMTTVDLIDGSAPGQVEIRWNSLEGEVLATGQGRNLSLPVLVPHVAAPGVYALVGVVRDTSGVATAKMSKAVQVVAPGASPVVSKAWTNLPVSADSTPGSNSGIPLSAGAAVLSIGVVALSAGFTLASLRRRRVAVACRR